MPSGDSRTVIRALPQPGRRRITRQQGAIQIENGQPRQAGCLTMLITDFAPAGLPEALPNVLVAGPTSQLNGAADAATGSAIKIQAINFIPAWSNRRTNRTRDSTSGERPLSGWRHDPGNPGVSTVACAECGCAGPVELL